MRLTCPSCAAEYEIDAAAVGRAGRMVRCAACAAEWFQPPAAPGIEEAAEAVEMAARRIRQDLIAPESRREPPPPPPVRPIEGDPAEEIFVDRDPPRSTPQRFDIDSVVEIEAPRPRRETPDPATLAATLRAAPDEPSAGGAFLAGFATVTFLVLALMAVYVKAPEIAALAPAAEAPLAAYAEIVNEGRTALAGVAQSISR